MISTKPAFDFNVIFLNVISSSCSYDHNNHWWLMFFLYCVSIACNLVSIILDGGLRFPVWHLHLLQMIYAIIHENFHTTCQSIICQDHLYTILPSHNWMIYLRLPHARDLSRKSWFFSRSGNLKNLTWKSLKGTSVRQMSGDFLLGDFEKLVIILIYEIAQISHSCNRKLNCLSSWLIVVFPVVSVSWQNHKIW